MATAPLKNKKLRNEGLSWYQRLDFKLALVFLTLLVLLAAGAFWAAKTLVQDGLLSENDHNQEVLANRAADQLDSVAVATKQLAAGLAELATSPTVSAESLSHTAMAMAKSNGIAPLISSFGIWPAAGWPGSTAQAMFWQRSSNTFQLTAAPGAEGGYLRERWFTPLPQLSSKRCLWSGARRDLAKQTRVILCAYPVQQEGRVVGAVTVSLSLEALSGKLSELQRENVDYLLLLDLQNHLLGTSNNAESSLGSGETGRSMADIARDHADFMPLALDQQKQAEARAAAVIKSSRYQATAVSALKEATPGLSRQEAEDLLIQAWGSPGIPRAGPLELIKDAALGSKAKAYQLASPEGAWVLLRITPTSTGFDGVSYVFLQALVVTLGLVTLTMLMIYISLRALIIHPLRTMASQLESSNSIEDALTVVLDESSRNEVGRLAHWQNERTRQLADALSSTRSARVQLSSESGERKALQEQLARAQERAALALHTVSDSVVVTDAHGLIEDMNPAAEALVGISLRNARGKGFDQIVDARAPTITNALHFARLAMENGERLERSDDLQLHANNGRVLPIWLSATPLRNRGQTTGSVVVFRERGGQGMAPSMAAAGANRPGNRDPITGLPMRGVCEQRLEMVLESLHKSGRTSALIFLDVDHLKRVNDFGGQSAGDEVMVRVAETLAGVAPVSTDVFRLAADQFAVLAEDVDAEQARAVAENLRQQLAGTRFYWESRHFSVTASFGVVLLGQVPMSTMEVIRCADDACAAAKRAGRNTVQLYDSSMDRGGRVEDDENWVRCIRRGLAEDLFHLRTQWILTGSEFAGEGHAFEVLLALEDDEGFWAAPAAFMPVAERHHLMPDIDRWVIKHTLDYLEAHSSVTSSLSFCAINLATLTLADPGFLEFMVQQLEHRPQLANKISFEVREPAITENGHQALPTCDALNKMGVRITVDHYLGRYMSDLTLMRRIPVDFVKIDALSYKNLSSDPVEQMLAESTFRIARHLRRRVMVTGIEDPRAQETWRKLGAHYFQGFAFAKPSPVIFLPPG